MPAFRRMLNIVGAPAACDCQERTKQDTSRIRSQVSTCGLWLLFQPREDSASVLLTKRGRPSLSPAGPKSPERPGATDQTIAHLLKGFICWGRGQEAQPGWIRAWHFDFVTDFVAVPSLPPVSECRAICARH